MIVVVTIIDAREMIIAAGVTNAAMTIDVMTIPAEGCEIYWREEMAVDCGRGL